MFWRLQGTMTATARILRQQALIRKRTWARGRGCCVKDHPSEAAVHAEDAMKSALERMEYDEAALSALVTGDRVALAEQIDATRCIVAQLDAFIALVHSAPHGSITL